MSELSRFLAEFWVPVRFGAILGASCEEMSRNAPCPQPDFQLKMQEYEEYGEEVEED
jgi:hypothetical protein